MEKGPFFGIRHVQVLFIFLVQMVMSIVRANISVTVVAMTNSKTTNPDFPEYNWNENEKSLILSSFFWGFILSVLPGSQLCRKLGVRLTLLICTFGSAVLCLITPVSMPIGDWKAYCAIRMMEGLFQGPLYPCIFDHLAKWSPTEEQSRLGALSHLGVEVGTILAILLPGYIAKSSLGWPGVSYISGGLAFVWCLFWYFFGENSPAISKYISKEEKDFILASQKLSDVTHKNIPVPWKDIFTSVPFLSLLLVKIAYAWGYITFQVETPIYMSSVLKMDIKSNSLFSALPYLAMLLMANVYILVADFLLKKNISLSVLRKIINSIAIWTSSGAFIALGYLNEKHKFAAVVIIIVSVGILAGSTLGCTLNVIDLSPNHSSTLSGVLFTFMGVAATITPICTGWLLSDETDYTQWRTVFFVAAVICFFGNLQYVIFGKMNIQPWNDKDYLNEKGVKEMEPLGTKQSQP